MCFKKKKWAISAQSSQQEHCVEDNLFQSKGAGFGLGRGDTSARGGLVTAEQLGCDLIHFELAMLKTYTELASELHSCLGLYW